jgi:hypothetical protein
MVALVRRLGHEDAEEVCHVCQSVTIWPMSRRTSVRLLVPISLSIESFSRPTSLRSHSSMTVGWGSAGNVEKSAGKMVTP